MISGVVHQVSQPYFAGSDSQAVDALPPLPGSPLIPKPAETRTINGVVCQISTPYSGKGEIATVDGRPPLPGSPLIPKAGGERDAEGLGVPGVDAILRWQARQEGGRRREGGLKIDWVEVCDFRGWQLM